MLLRQDSLAPMSSFLMRSTLRLVSLMVKPMGKIVCVPSLFMETSTKEETTKQERCSLQPIQVRGFAVYCSFDFIKICTAKNNQCSVSLSSEVKLFTFCHIKLKLAKC